MTQFEGPEKKVELVVVDGHPSLRALGDDVWRKAVRAAQAEILSKASTSVFDAYLLSESSLFVYDEHLTMITCGRTRLADAIEAMLEVIPVDAVAFLAFERKNEHFPWKQPTTFTEDARRLAGWIDGRALRFGDEHGHNIQLFHSTRAYEPEREDVTLEVLMHGIQDQASVFQGESARRAGLDEVLPAFAVDDHVFSPSGYSLNGLKDEFYYTFHVTPGQVGSYVSFETNVDFRAEPSALIARVVGALRPTAFDVLAFLPGGEGLDVQVPGFHVSRHVQEPVCGYGVTFKHFYAQASAARSASPIDLS